MFSRHVTKDISAYCHGELSTEESKQFAEHIIACARCRAKYEEVKLGIKLAEQLPQLSAPDRLWSQIESEIDNPTPPISVPPPSPRPLFWSWPFQTAATAAVVLLLVFADSWFFTSQTIPPHPVPPFVSLNPSWRVTRLDGTPRVDDRGISNDARLDVGQWLETDDKSRAEIEVGSIGNVEIDENTRVRVVANELTEFRLELVRGKMSARIWAPPRLFFVDTPSAVAADLGCAYTLEVGDDGGSLLRVTSGWVALQLRDRESLVPAGAMCETRPGIGPGTPYFQDAPSVFRDALQKIDFGDDADARRAALETILAWARTRDTLTLWHLLPRFDREDRVRVYEKMVALIPPPPHIDHEAVLRLDQRQLESWKFSLQLIWISGEKGSSKIAGDAYGKDRKQLSPRMKDMMPK
ncbi:MAG TPA: FecR domain-containing protein [Pyrinomonadaceae bacterium]|nr:FecR domain-containing protein [Pyrinomonadaceae bacterium]